VELIGKLVMQSNLTGGADVSNALKLAALHWAYPTVHQQRFQIPWDSNAPQYGKYHYAFAKGQLTEILAYTEANCPVSDRDGIRAWMKGGNPDDLHVGIDCNGFVYRVLDQACRMTGARTLLETMGEPCEYVSIDELTLPNQLVTRARDIRAGDAIRFNHGWHSGVVIETVTDPAGHLIQVWYAHSSFTRGPHVGHVEIGDPDAPLNDGAQNWVDQMWDALTDNGIRDRYFQSI
jgi:hypothetical protein